MSIEMLKTIAQNSPAAMALVRGSDFRFEFVNPAYAALAAGEPMVGRTVAEVWPAAATVTIPLLQGVRTSRSACHRTNAALPLHRGPGTAVEERYFDFSCVPLDDDCVLMEAIELTARRCAEQELFHARHELAAIRANAPVALFTIEEHLCGLPGDALGCVDAITSEGGCGKGPACETCAIRSAALDSLTNGVRHQNVEAWVPLMVNGRTERRCLLVSTAPISVGVLKKVLVCAQDITELKRTVSQLEAALSEKNVLFKEVHHRVKNNLAVVSSLLRMKADAAGTREAKLALEESHQRVHAMSLIHEQLYESDHLDRIRFPMYAKQLINRLQHAFGTKTRVKIEAHLDAIELGVEQAVPCGLILNELLTNAFKYAFPGGNRGKIVVSFHKAGEKTLELAVEDNGIGLSAPLRAGSAATFGLRIVGILTNQLDGVLEHQPCPGTRIVLRFPMRSDVLSQN